MIDPILTRRQFGKGLTGIVVAFSMLPKTAWSAGVGLPGNLGVAPMLDAWLRIDAKGGVTVFTGKVEIGQGALTALAQIAAEELDVALPGIRMVSGDTALTPNEGYTSGSQSIEYGGAAIRYACAEARAILIEKASAKFGVPAKELTVANGIISAGDGRKLTYGQIAASDLFHREATAKVAPKPPSEHEIVGKPVPRLDIPGKILGAPMYVQDMRLPGMAFGRIVRPPGPRARLESVDTASVQRMPGVIKVVRDGSFLGVTATREEQAIAASEALRQSAKWAEAADLPESGKIHAWLKAQPSEAQVINEKGDAAAAPVARRIEATYTKRYVAHASIGPSCAVAELKGGTPRNRSAAARHPPGPPGRRSSTPSATPWVAACVICRSCRNGFGQRAVKGHYGDAEKITGKHKPRRFERIGVLPAFSVCAHYALEQCSFASRTPDETDHRSHTRR